MLENDVNELFERQRLLRYIFTIRDIRKMSLSALFLLNQARGANAKYKEHTNLEKYVDMFKGVLSRYKTGELDFETVLHGEKAGLISSILVSRFLTEPYRYGPQQTFHFNVLSPSIYTNTEAGTIGDVTSAQKERYEKGAIETEGKDFFRRSWIEKNPEGTHKGGRHFYFSNAIPPGISILIDDQEKERMVMYTVTSLFNNIYSLRKGFAEELKEIYMAQVLAADNSLSTIVSVGKSNFPFLNRLAESCKREKDFWDTKTKSVRVSPQETISFDELHEILDKPETDYSAIHSRLGLVYGQFERWIFPQQTK